LSNNDLLARFNFASAFALNNIKGTTVAADKFMTNAGDRATATKQIEKSILFDQASAQTRKALEKLAADTEHSLSQPVAPVPIPASATSWAAAPKPQDPAKVLSGQLVALALGSPEFQRK